MKRGDKTTMRKLIPSKIHIDIGDIRARFEYALGKEQVTAEQVEEVNKACDKITAILPNVKRNRRSEPDDG